MYEQTDMPGMPPLPKKRGRPASGNAKTGAERMKALREKREIQIVAAVGTCANLSDEGLRAEMGQTNDAEVFEI